MTTLQLEERRRGEDRKEDTTAFVARLRALDVALWAEGDRLRYSAPKGALTEELRRELGERKGELLRLLGTARTAAPPPVLPAPAEERRLLSSSQLRLWFLVEFEPGTPAYNLSDGVELTGRLEVAQLARALAEVVRRHEALRTTFSAVRGEPVQVIAPRLALPLPVVDLGRLAAAEREAEATRLARRLALTAFDLVRGPLARVLLLRLDPARHRFLFSVHHIVFDRWSMGVFIREVVALYGAFAAGRPSPLSEPRIHYADFAAWQRRWLRGPVLESLLAYWRRQLAAAPPVLPLPLDRPRPAIRSSHGALLPAGLPADLTRRLNELGGRRGATLFMVLLAGLKALLARTTGAREVSVGTFIANRNRPEVEDLIGFFVNTLVLSTGLAGDPGFDRLLARVQGVTLGAYAHQDLPFEKLLEELQPGREMSHSPLFQVMLVLQNTPAPPVALPGLDARPLTLDAGVWAHFDWTLWLWPEGEGLAGYLDYATDLFDAATLRRMLGHYRTLLEGVVAAPERPLSALPLLEAAERQQVTREWNDRRRGGSAPAPVPVPAAFEARAGEMPDAVAVVAGGEQISYRELDRWAGRVADRLLALGVAPEDRVGLFFDRCPDMVAAVLAVLEAGAAYVPVEASAPRDRVADLFAGAAVSALVTRRELASSLPAAGRPVVAADEVRAAPDGAGAPGSPPRPAGVSAENLAYVLFTSGSTGRSKGVMVSRGSLAHAGEAWREGYALEPGLRHLQLASFSFDVCTADLVRTLTTGGRLVLCPLEVLLAPARLARRLAAERIDFAEFVPAVFRPLVRHVADTGGGGDLPRTLVVGAEAWHVRELREVRSLCPPGTRVVNSYGLTETTVDSSLFDGEPVLSDPEAAIPIGRPFRETALYVLAADLTPAPVGVVGELFVGGAGVARGYFGRPALTAEKFVPDPLGGGRGDRLYRTGDRARHLADGNVEFLGRADHQIKVRGFRIEPGEIEAVLGEHPAVMAAVVAPWEAEGDRRLAAYVVPFAPDRLDAGELRAFLKRRLPEYMVPSAFVPLDDLPLTASGKVDRRALPPPEAPGPEDLAGYRPPGNGVEEILAEIFARVLSRERVGVDDDFFALGGHSLLATQVIARASEAFRIELPLRLLFEAPTVAELALAVEERVLETIDGFSDEEVEALL